MYSDAKFGKPALTQIPTNACTVLTISRTDCALQG